MEIITNNNKKIDIPNWCNSILLNSLLTLYEDKQYKIDFSYEEIDIFIKNYEFIENEEIYNNINKIVSFLNITNYKIDYHYINYDGDTNIDYLINGNFFNTIDKLCNNISIRELLERSVELQNYNFISYIKDNKELNWRDTFDILRIACKSDNLELVKYLIANFECNYVNCVSAAAYEGHLNIVKYLIENNIDTYFNQIIDLAASGGNLDVLDWCHKYSINNNIDFGYKYGLNWCASNGHLHCVKYFIENKDSRIFQITQQTITDLIIDLNNLLNRLNRLDIPLNRPLNFEDFDNFYELQDYFNLENKDNLSKIIVYLREIEL